MRDWAAGGVIKVSAREHFAATEVMRFDMNLREGGGSANYTYVYPERYLLPIFLPSLAI